MDTITDSNKNKLEKYVDILYILKPLFDRVDSVDNFDYVDKLYKIFFKKYDKEIFKDSYIKCTGDLNDVIIYNVRTNIIYKYKIDTILPKFTFNTYKIY